VADSGNCVVKTFEFRKLRVIPTPAGRHALACGQLQSLGYCHGTKILFSLSLLTIFLFIKDVALE